MPVCITSLLQYYFNLLIVFMEQELRLFKIRRAEKYLSIVGKSETFRRYPQKICIQSVIPVFVMKNFDRII